MITDPVFALISQSNCIAIIKDFCAPETTGTGNLSAISVILLSMRNWIAVSFLCQKTLRVGRTEPSNPSDKNVIQTQIPKVGHSPANIYFETITNFFFQLSNFYSKGEIDCIFTAQYNIFHSEPKCLLTTC